VGFLLGQPALVGRSGDRSNDEFVGPQTAADSIDGEEHRGGAAEDGAALVVRKAQGSEG